MLPAGSDKRKALCRAGGGLGGSLFAERRDAQREQRWTTPLPGRRLRGAAVRPPPRRAALSASPPARRSAAGNPSLQRCSAKRERKNGVNG